MSDEVRIGSLRLKFLIEDAGYFEDIAAVVNAGGPPDMAKVKAVMDKYGLVVA